MNIEDGDHGRGKIREIRAKGNWITAEYDIQVPLKKIQGKELSQGQACTTLHGVYISQVSLRNIRGFESLDFDLTRPDGTFAGWTVFTGNNGSGKSSLLKAIALALIERDDALKLQVNFNGWVRDTAATQLSYIIIKCVVEAGDDRFDPGLRTNISEYSPALFFDSSGNNVILESFPSARWVELASSEPDLKVHFDWALKHLMTSRNLSLFPKLLRSGLAATQAFGWFCCGYGPFRRMLGASSDAEALMANSSTARFVTMFSEAASLSEAERWLQRIYLKSLEEKQEETGQLELVKAILNDELMPHGTSLSRLDSDGLWIKSPNKAEHTWNDMSDGYRSSLLLLIDILRHMFQVYGVKNLTESVDGRLVIKRSGVVLIDEVDAHLHPEWQRTIGFWLKKRFPKVQFLVTTHSPIICQAADPNGIFVLPDFDSEEKPRALTTEEYQKVIASRPDTILRSPAFGLTSTRSELADVMRARLAKLNAKSKAGPLTEAEEQDREISRRYMNPEEKF